MIDEAPYEPRRMSDTARSAAREGIERARQALEQPPAAPSSTTVIDKTRVRQNARPGITSARAALHPKRSTES